MAQPLFDTAECNLNSVASIGYQFIDDCDILPSPQPIFDCPLIEIPFDPPVPALDVPCPEIEATLNVAMLGGCDSTAGEVTTETSHGAGGGCKIKLAFNLAIAIPKPPCPEISGSAGITVVEGDPGVDIVITTIQIPNSAGSCNDSANRCRTMFDFNFQIPPPRCPSLTGSATATVTDGDPGVDLTITAGGSAGSACAAHFDFHFQLPTGPCPTITGSATLTETDGDPGVDLTVTNGGSTGSACAAHFDFDFRLPPPRCPSISGNLNFEVTDGEPEAELAVTTGDGSICEATFDFRIRLPRTRCTSLQALASATEVEGDPGVDVTVTPGSNCAATFEFNFRLPRGSAGSAGATGSDGLDGADGADGDSGLDGNCTGYCYGGESICQLWIWCAVCGDAPAWVKPDGYGWEFGDPPYPTWSGTQLGQATITCHCPDCDSYSSISSISSGSSQGADWVETVCCPDRLLPGLLYSCLTSNECSWLDGLTPELQVRPGTSEWVTSRFILCGDFDNDFRKEVELEVTCDGFGWRAELHFYDLVNPALDFTVQGSLVSNECDPFRLEFNFSVTTNPCCDSGGNSTINVVISETPLAC